MSAYIPLIKTTKWIDLSSDHKKLRNELEYDTLQVCVNKEQLQPIMLQGAFGIGKTNSLYYLFHYGWCVLKTPTFLVSLDELTKTIKDFALAQPSGKIQNSELGPFINRLLKSQIECLKTAQWAKLDLIYFPEFKGGNLTKYLNDFNPVEIIEDASKGVDCFPISFSENVIREAIQSENRPLLLIDEFESKFYELKKYIETSGGGVLRELFDQIVQDQELFYLVIGNGPASGYEIARERGDESSDSETAANRRLKTKPIPFPTANLLQRSFLKEDPKGYINFIWWLSRCRPGHILKLRDALGSFEDLLVLSTNELITKAIFKEPIDEGGEAVSYLKTGFFNQIAGRIQAAILGKLISNFQPVEFEIKSYKQELKECVPYFYCATNLVNSDIDLLSVLRDDLYSIHLKKFEEEGKYDSINYIEHLQPYFSYILNGISDNEGNIAFGMINDSKPDEVLSQTFIIPLLELTYDFISLYQDDSIKEIRETLDFLLNIINQISASNEKGELETFLPNTFDLFEKCKLLRNDKVYLQLSLFSIRESIEQPIGSPRLKYKSEQVGNYISDLDLGAELPLIWQKENNLSLYFIPDLSDELLDKYLNGLETHLNSTFDKFHKDGELVTRIIFLNKNEKIEKFAERFLYRDGDLHSPEPIFLLKKIDVVDIETYQLNFGSQIVDYIDSVAKIGIIGWQNRELKITTNSDQSSILDLKAIINIIGDRPWTEKKETIRTIEHYRKLLFDGDNSILKVIHGFVNREYKDKLSEYVTDENNFKSNINDYYYFDKIVRDETEAYDRYSSIIALIYLLENKSVEEPMKQLLELCKNEYRFEIDKDNPDRGINFKSIVGMLTKDKGSLATHFQEFDFNSDFISSLFSLSKMLLWEDELTNIEECYLFLKDKSETSFFRSYHKVLGGGYLTSDLSESLYNLANLSTIDKIKISSEISEKVSEIEDSLAEVRVNIVTKLDELKIIVDESQVMSSYPEKLSRVIKGIGLIKTTLADNHTYGTLLLVNSVVEHFKRVVTDSKRFYQQLNSIYKSISDQKGKVDDVQDEIDELYNDPLTERLLSFDFPVKRNEQYLWKKIFLSGNLKNKEEYEKIFGQSKNYYNPFTGPIIFPDILKNFQQCLLTVYNKVSPSFNDLLAKMKEKQDIAESTKELENYIEQLLTVNEE